MCGVSAFVELPCLSQSVTPTSVPTSSVIGPRPGVGARSSTGAIPGTNSKPSLGARSSTSFAALAGRKLPLNSSASSSRKSSAVTSPTSPRDSVFGLKQSLGGSPTDRRGSGPRRTSYDALAVKEELASQLKASLTKISHRGPDGAGVWISDNNKIGLGHCRLSIVDLSEAGAQPYHSTDGQVHAVVNGEIYDYDNLRAQLTERGYAFKGHSDSELVIALYAVYGAPRFLDFLRGEFAFVLCDERQHKVVAARDRYGVKPLYWTTVEDGECVRVLLASEAKAFLPMGWEPEWDVGAIASGGTQCDDRTLFKGVRRVMPGTFLQISSLGKVRQVRYWDSEYPQKHVPECRTEQEMIQGVRERLIEAVRIRLKADVPVGLYLSGGIDSSAVAGITDYLVNNKEATMGSVPSGNRIRCYTIAFPKSSGYDESSIAERTAEQLQLELIKVPVDEEDLARNFADSAYHCEHHNFDLNSVGKFVLSKVPREHGCKVVLTGEGADELFAGYPNFPPDFLREPDHSMPGSSLPDDDVREEICKEAEQAWTSAATKMGLFQHDYASSPQRSTLNNIISPSLIGAWQPPKHIFSPWVRDARGTTSDSMAAFIAAQPASTLHKIQQDWHPLHSSLHVWTKTILPNVILSSEGDRPEMAHSIESRPPFLDHVLAGYVDGLPPSVKIAYRYSNDNGKASTTSCAPGADGVDQGVWSAGAAGKNGGAASLLTEKHILREAAKPFISRELYARKKHPYTAPVLWPRDGALHGLFQRTLTEEAIEQLGFVDWAVVRDALERGFGEGAEAAAFRMLLMVASWVVIGERMGVRRAEREEYGIDGDEEEISPTASGGDSNGGSGLEGRVGVWPKVEEARVKEVAVGA